MRGAILANFVHFWIWDNVGFWQKPLSLPPPLPINYERSLSNLTCLVSMWLAFFTNFKLHVPPQFAKWKWEDFTNIQCSCIFT